MRIALLVLALASLLALGTTGKAPGKTGHRHFLVGCPAGSGVDPNGNCIGG
jgi:hypothetical protein